MLGSQIIDVAIGIVFVYLLISLLCSAAHELIERFVKWRATDLERGIRELLHGSVDDGKLAKDLYEHPLIYGLYKGGYGKGARNLPSYIPARNFALALLDTIFPATATNPGGTAGTTPPTPLPANSNPAPPVNPVLPARCPGAVANGSRRDRQHQSETSSFATNNSRWK